MIRSNAVRVEVHNPTVGLWTRIPSDSPDRKGGRALTVAQNVRAERGVLMNAPGFERIVPRPTNLDSAANLIFQAEITSSSPDVRTTPIIATGGKVYVLQRRSQPLVCNLGTCRLTAALVGDTQADSPGLAAVKELIASWNPDVVCHLGDLAYGGSGTFPLLYNLEETVGRYYHPWIGGYNGFWGTGPTYTKFFPVVGNHDWDDQPIEEFYDFFNLPKPERYYTFKRGPVQFFVFSSVAHAEPHGVSPQSVQGQWLQGALAASDCPWRIILTHYPPKTSDITHYPGVGYVEWLRTLPGVTALICGHAHNMEVIKGDGAPLFICGTGGATLRSFHDPVLADSVWRNAGEFGAIRLDANTEQLTLKFINTDRDLLYTETFAGPVASSGVCYISDAARQPLTLEVRPSTASVEVGFSWPFEAWVTCADGNVLNVTNSSTWSSSNEAVAAVGALTGTATGRAPGASTITAYYEGLNATAQLTVLTSCVDLPLDAILVVERSDSGATVAGGVTNRLQATVDAATLFVDTLISSDRAGLVSYAGTFATQTEDALLDSVLTDQFGNVKAALSLLVPAGARSLPAALELARAEHAARTRGNAARRMVVLVAHGLGDVTSPGGNSTSQSAGETAAMAAAVTQANLIKGDGTTLVVIGYDVTGSAATQLSALATNGDYHSVFSPEELNEVLGNLAHSFCEYYAAP
jgi:hypothetical protein